mgnify:CR=1 FL=1
MFSKTPRILRFALHSIAAGALLASASGQIHAQPAKKAKKAATAPATATAEPVTLNFANAEIEAVARTMATITGRNVVVDPRVKGQINLVAERPVPPAVAFDQFLAALRLQGFTVVEAAGLYKVVPEADAKLQAASVGVSQGGTGTTLQGGQIATQIFKLNFENANNLVETKFEPGLKLRPVASLDELNTLAKAWRENFNATEIHRRHGQSRSLVWMTIRADQLIKAPSVEVCRELAVATPESRKVTPKLRVSFQGREYDVSTVPGVMVGEKVMVTRNPWRDDAAQVVLVGEDGRDVFHVVHEVFKDELGFSEKAAVFGESYKRHADTPAQTALKDIEQLVTGTDSQAAAEAARKAKSLPFGGQLDPYKHIDDATLPTYLPRRGTAHDLVAPKVELPPLSHVDAAKQIKPRVESAGGEWTADRFRWLQQRYPAGVPQDQLDTIVAELSGPRAGHQKPLQLLRAAGGE